MNVQELTKLVVKKVNLVFAPYTHSGAKNVQLSKDWHLVLKLEGLSWYNFNDRTYISDRNHVILIPGGCEVPWHCEKGGSVLVIDFTADIDGECDHIFHFRIQDSAVFQEIHKNMELARIIKPDVYELDWRKGLYELLSILIEQYLNPLYSSGEAVKKIKPAVEYIAENYNTPITNDILAEKCKISTVYFRKLFTSVYGVSPRTYLFQVRMDTAKRMLRFGDYKKIETVASLVGYKDVYQFSKMFKKYTGISPKKYAYHNKLKRY